MSNPLLSHYYKLYRANEHLQSLYPELAAFLQPDCYEIVNEFDVKGQITDQAAGSVRGLFRRRIVFNREPPLLRWGTLIGDVIQNLRSALDHAIFAISYSRNPAEFRDDRTTEFPICDNVEAFNRPRRRGGPPRYKIRGLPPDAQAIVEGLQPYRRGNENLTSDPLWILREMSNIDKHRSIHVTTWSAYSIALDITQIMPGARIHSHRVRPPGVIESGATIVEIDLTTPGPGKPAMHMQKEFLFTIAFDEDTPLVGQQVQSALYDLGLYVEGIIESLSRFVAE